MEARRVRRARIVAARNRVRVRVTLDAELKDARALQELRIVRAVRRVAA